MRNVHEFLMQRHGSEKSRWSTLSKISKPLEYIQLSPTVVENTGSHGIMATARFDVTPQIHASLSKNILLREDNPALQIDYALSDELGLRIKRDPQGDIGAEVELSFQF